MHRTAARDARLFRPLAAGLGALVLALLSLGVQADDRSNDRAADRAQMLRAIEHHSARAALETGVARPDAAVLQVLGRLPRERFVPPDVADRAYEDRPLPIGYGQTISQPYIVALMTHLLRPGRGQRVLEIGTGSGYQAAVLAELVREVDTLEIVAPLAESARTRLQALGYRNVRVRQADGYYGWAERAPYDGIIVTAAAGSVPPPLVQQLKPGGRMIIPVGSAFAVQTLLLIEKLPDGSLRSEQLLPVRFVPLSGGH